MSLQRATAVMFWAFAGIVVLSCCSVALAATHPTGDVLTLLVHGSAQVVLAVSLLAVTGALCIAFRIIIAQHRERVLALERALDSMAAMTTEKASAEVRLSDALDQMREHCKEMNGK